jgi:hypothetical protein
MSRWGLVISVRWRKVPAGPVRGADVDAVELAADVRPGVPAGVLGVPGQEQGEPAEEDVGADAFFLAVVDGAQVDDLFDVAPAALDLQELLVAEGDVLGGELRVGGAEQVLAVEVLLGLGLGGIGAEQAAGGDAQVAVQARSGRDHAAQFGTLVLAELVRVLDGLFELGDHPGPDGGVALGGLGAEADDEPLVLGDPHRQCGGGMRLYTDDFGCVPDGRVLTSVRVRAGSA